MKNSEKLEKLKSLIPDLQRETELAPYTTWKIGGKAEAFWEPDSKLLPAVLQFCKEEEIPVWFLGRGSNTLISSKGLKGVVICTKRSLQQLSHCGEGYIEAESGVPLPKLSRYAAQLGYGGYEFLIGIPGTVGGGIVINAGLTAGKRMEISERLSSVELLLPDGRVVKREVSELKMGYRSSNLLDKGIFLLKATFLPTEKRDEDDIRKKTAQHLAERRRKQPLNMPTAGSTFKQPKGGKPAGWYIDHAGLKGLQIGGARVSKKHANWIENLGNATSSDVLNLITEITQKVESQFGVVLENEVRFFE